MANDAADEDLAELSDLDVPLAKASGKKDGSAKGSSSKGDDTKKKTADGSPLHVVYRLILGSSGLMLVAGFFLPWIRLDAVNPQQAAQGARDAFVSGLAIAVGGDTLVSTASGATPWEVLFLIPLMGAALTAVALLGNRWSGVIAAGLGVLIVGYGAVTVVMLFFRTTNYGLWLVLGGAFVAVAGGTMAWVRSRQPPTPPQPKIKI